MILLPNSSQMVTYSTDMRSDSFLQSGAKVYVCEDRGEVWVGLLEVLFNDVKVLLSEVGVDENLLHLFVPLAVELAATR